ncbi:MAG: two-component system, NtrC family, nitrogen regulation sensor histidine kinase NtrY [Acidobacteriota bacterium]|jgi:two-component system nitrogen regulation sensor histidine kinase NtrY|nr:two-component system, NtrC family, nitrogen regulation sensor histidine kinase NtrY [Acidobacteriota bacterium]
MGLRQKIVHHRKNNRLILGGLAALLLLFTALFYMAQRGRDLPAELVTNKVLLFVLWYVNVVLILIILFVLLRNLIKLLVERRHRVLGSTFKFKLVATYVGLSLIPVLLLFAIATELLRGSIDRWFNTPVAPVLERGNAVAQALYDQIERTNVRDANRVLREIQGLDLGDAQQRPRLNRRLQDLLEELHLDLLAVYEGRELVHAMVNTQTGIRDLPEPDRSFLEEAAKTGKATEAQVAQGSQGRLLLAAVARPTGVDTLPPVPTTEEERKQVRPPVIVIAGTLLDPVLSEQREKLVQDYQAYRQLEVQKDDLRASHMLLFLMVTMVILLASSWTGLYLARRVTVPIQALAEGTRRISGGDLSHRVVVEADDELGVLVDSFNSMTQQLASNKELLERSNLELTTSNERLAAERALIAAVLQNVAAGVVSIDSDGCIFTCNGAALDMLRQREDEVVGRTVDEAWADPERRRLATVVREAGQGTTDREVHLTLGGEWKTFEVKVTALRDTAGAVQGRVLVIEDLTELIKAQQLAAWNEAARRIAHEIKNPLTPIRLSAERLLRKHRLGDPGLGQAIEEGVEIIVREVVTLQGMVDEFSRYARMPRPRPAPVDLSRLVGETLHLYQNLKPGVEVESEVDPSLATVWIDGEQVRRALINLLDNAVEATEAPGRVTVTAHGADGHLEIQVADTGRGIPADAKEKLFLPYYSTKGRGTGLGLAIVHRIVTDHQGSIRVEDNAPQGTVFTVELPMG